MKPITNILFPVNFSSSCIAMTPYVKKAAALFGAPVIADRCVRPGQPQRLRAYYVRKAAEIAEEHLEIARNTLHHSFLQAEFPGLGTSQDPGCGGCSGTDR